jgi:hypothetical protein
MVGFQVANVSNGGRVLESFEEEDLAIARAKDLSRLLSNRQSLAGNLTNEAAVTFNAAMELLAPARLALLPTIQTAIDAVKMAGRALGAIRWRVQVRSVGRDGRGDPALAGPARSRTPEPA